MRYTKHPDGYSWTFLSEPNNDGSQRILGSMRLDPDNALKETFEYWNSDDTEQKLMYELGLKLKWKVKRRSFYAKHESAFQLPKGKKLLVLCEGKTEKCYLDALCRELFILDEVDVKVSEQKDPGDVIEAVTKQHLWDRLLGCESYSETWLVFDRDGHKGYERALMLQDKIPFVHLAFTNPCFEYWLLLHLDEFLPESLPFDRERVLGTEMETFEVTPFTKMRVTEEILSVETKPESCLKTLKALMPSYQKNDPKVFKTFASKMRFACGRASLEPHRGHGSTMPKLIDRLYKLAGKAGFL